MYNSGVSGPGDVTGARTAPMTDFATLDGDLVSQPYVEMTIAVMAAFGERLFRDAFAAEPLREILPLTDEVARSGAVEAVDFLLEVHRFTSRMARYGS